MSNREVNLLDLYALIRNFIVKRFWFFIVISIIAMGIGFGQYKIYGTKYSTNIVLKSNLLEKTVMVDHYLQVIDASNVTNIATFKELLEAEDNVTDNIIAVNIDTTKYNNAISFNLNLTNPDCIEDIKNAIINEINADDNLSKLIRKKESENLLVLEIVNSQLSLYDNLSALNDENYTNLIESVLDVKYASDLVHAKLSLEEKLKLKDYYTIANSKVTETSKSIIVKYMLIWFVLLNFINLLVLLILEAEIKLKKRKQ